MRPWIFDSRKFEPDEDSKILIHRTPKINKYLEVGSNDDQFFLIGPKGLGKTMLLRYKSWLYHKDGSYKCNTTSKQLTESLSIRYGTFSKEELSGFREVEIWEDIWKFCLMIVVIRTYGLEIDRRLSDMLHGVTDLSSLLTEILTNRKNLVKYLRFYSVLLSQVKNIDSGVAIFVDNVDQEFQTILQDPHYHVEDLYGDAVKIWSNVQNGLMKAIYNLSTQNNHIRIFATIRSEAFRNFNDPLKANIRNYCTELEYSKEQIKAIFENNIQLMKKEHYVDPSRKSLIHRFLGFEEMTHPFVLDEYKNKRSESAFEFLYRHSYGRPRDIVRFGSFIYDEIISEDYRRLGEREKIEKIRRIVNDQSHELFKEYQEEIIPRFMDEWLEKLMLSIRKNVIRQNELQRIDRQVLTYFYNLGLIGVTRMENNVLIQKFLPPAVYNYSDLNELPNSKYYFTHPSIDKTFIDKHSYESFYNKNNIIGKDKPFFEISEASQDVSYYTPKSVQGGRWLNPNHANSQALPLNDYFTRFYSTDDDNLLTLRENCHASATEALSLIANAYFCYRLQQKFGDRCVEASASVQTKLLALIQPEFKTQLKQDLSMPTMRVMAQRIFGRLVTLGCYLYLNLECKVIHHLLIEKVLNFTISDRNGDSAYRYLQSCFFIDGLVNDNSPRGRNAKLHARQKIFANLSSFEQHLLNDWRQSIDEGLPHLNWLDSDQITWIRENILQEIWRPVALPDNRS